MFDKLRVGGTRQSSNSYKHSTNTVNIRHCHYIHGRAFLGHVLRNNQEPSICTGLPRVVHDEISCATYGRRYQVLSTDSTDDAGEEMNPSRCRNSSTMIPVPAFDVSSARDTGKQRTLLFGFAPRAEIEVQHGPGR